LPKKITSGEIELSKVKIKTSFSKLHILIEILQYSLINNKELLTFINNISNENIRKSIELIKKFFGSGHVDMQKMLDIKHEKETYLIPLHELLRSVIFGDNIYYSPYNSEIVNVFDVRSSRHNDHFILPIFLGLLNDSSKNNRNYGFIAIKDIYSYLQGMGFISSQIDNMLNFSYARRFFETSNKGDSIEINNTDLKIRITNTAIYHYTFLIQSFAYIDAIVVDTPIFLGEHRSKIHNQFNIEERLVRCKVFVSYLDTIWKDSKFGPTYFNWPEKSYEIHNYIQKIQEKRKK
jgi:hypothetical protein